MATITRMKNFQFFITVEKYLVEVEFDFSSNPRRKNYGWGMVFVKITDRESLHYKLILEKCILDIDDRNQFKVFYKSAKTFLKLHKQLSKVKTLNEVLNLL
jgi:hypothetical protein